MGFSHRGFFRAGVWAHPAKSLCVWPPLCMCVCVLGEVHGCYMWLGCVEVEVVSLCGCGCLQACTTTLNDAMWLWVFAGVHNDAKPIQCHGRER